MTRERLEQAIALDKEIKYSKVLIENYKNLIDVLEFSKEEQSIKKPEKTPGIKIKFPFLSEIKENLYHIDNESLIKIYKKKISKQEKNIIKLEKELEEL